MKDSIYKIVIIPENNNLQKQLKQILNMPGAHKEKHERQYVQDCYNI